MKFKDYFLIIMQLRDLTIKAAKGEEEEVDFSLNKLRYELVSPNDLCIIAIQLHQWEHFLRIIDINELRVYSAGGYITKPKLEDPKGT